jgi:carboxymethylenebutenolidase
VATTPDEALAAMKAVAPEVALERMSAGVERLKGDARVLPLKVGVIGWCFGGAQALSLALARADLAVAVIYYGRLVTDPERLRSIGAKVIGIFGTRDRSIPQETVDAFERGLEQAGVVHEVHRFDADHAFANPSNARAYQSASAAEAWSRVRAFLARHLRP